jgi:hypothetical protein
MRRREIMNDKQWAVIEEFLGETALVQNRSFLSVLPTYGLNLQIYEGNTIPAKVATVYKK